MLPIAANVSSSQVFVNSTTVSGILKAVPTNLWPENCAGIEQRSSTFNLPPPIDHDFVVIAEFCEIEGPKPTIILPEDYSLLFDLDGYMLRIFSADTSGLQFSSSFGSGSLVNRPDCEACILDRVTGTYAFVHYVTLRDVRARGYVRPFAIIYLTPSEEKLQSQMERICCILRSAVGDMRRANIGLFSTQLVHRLDSMSEDDPKFDQFTMLLKEFSQSLDKSVDEVLESTRQLGDVNFDRHGIGSLWDLCGRETVDHIIRLFNRLLDNLSAAPAALTVTAIRTSALDLSSSGESVVFMNRLALLPPIAAANANSVSPHHADMSLFSYFSAEAGTGHGPNASNAHDEKSVKNDSDSSGSIIFVENVSPVPQSPSDSFFQTSLQSVLVGSLRWFHERDSNNSASVHSNLDIAAMTLPYFIENAWPRGILPDILQDNHKTVAQALIWLAVGLPLVIAGNAESDILFELASELASISPTSSIYASEEGLSLRGITVVSSNSAVVSPVDLPASSPSLWVEQDSSIKDGRKLIVSAWGPTLSYSPFTRLFRRIARFQLGLPMIRLLLANHWTFLVHLAFLYQHQSDPSSTLDRILKRLGHYPADGRFVPAAMVHLRWLASLS